MRENQDLDLMDELPQQGIFALDIGTRSIIGMVGIQADERIEIVAIERADHNRRAMIDGQIEDIDQVAKVAGVVKKKLEEKLGCRLKKVAIAAAGRALRTESAAFELELSGVQTVDAETVSRLEAGAISEAEKAFLGGVEESGNRFYLVGYTVCRYYLDNYMLSNLIDHRGQKLRAEIIATFLPAEVVESLYAAMNKAGLEVVSLTLEPIAAINAAIPQNIRLLNLAMVDIGAGTSDIAVCRDGSVTGYTMAVVAGDEITEAVMKAYLVDFETAERIKAEIADSQEITFTDIMGFEQTAEREHIMENIREASDRLCGEIGAKIKEANGGVPSAVYLAGGGSRLLGLKEGITEHLGMDPKRVAVAGRNYKTSAFSQEYDLDVPEYATPLGIVISAGLNMINDSFRVFLNDRPAKLFRSGIFTVMNILMMNGYSYQDMMGRSGQNLMVYLNGRRKVFYGEKAEPSVLKLNGEDAQMSGLVHAGDHITFIPAKNGQAASAMLSDLVGPWEDRDIYINGRKAKDDIALQHGDVVSVEGMEDDTEEQPDGTETAGAKSAPEHEAGADGAELEREKVEEFKEAAPEAKTEYTENVPDAGQGSAESASALDPEYIGEAPAIRPESVNAEFAAEPELAEKALTTAPESAKPAAAAERKPAENVLDAGADHVDDENAVEPESKIGEDLRLLEEAAAENEPEPERIETKRPAARVFPSRPGGIPVMAFAAGEQESAGTQAAKSQAVRRERAKKPAAGVKKRPRMYEAPQPVQERPVETEEAWSAVPERQSAEGSAGLTNMLLFYLNDKSMLLPPKADQTPYYLMDMLEYSGLDFRKLTSPVIMEVNGQSGAFQQELKNGDRIRIYQK